ncbi:MAG: hypothetical protein UY31_C0027G0002 [Candidatus Wolfebacteria bacterium GW2011_GWE1_48_7]|nr:MAG: hypothetical protein UY31_C0027G0002 [Candidatus Wolfebacteria bacterium GW2011_GWE1_48_7]
MRASVLVVGDEIVKTGEGELFHCLAGDAFERVYHVGFIDAFEQYRETAEDGWSMVIIDGGLNENIMQLMNQLRDVNADQQIVVVDKGFAEIVEFSRAGIIVPRDGEILSRALRELGMGASV